MKYASYRPMLEISKYSAANFTHGQFLRRPEVDSIYLARSALLRP